MTDDIDWDQTYFDIVCEFAGYVQELFMRVPPYKWWDYFEELPEIWQSFVRDVDKVSLDLGDFIPELGRFSENNRLYHMGKVVMEKANTLPSPDWLPEVATILEEFLFQRMEVMVEELSKLRNRPFENEEMFYEMVMQLGPLIILRIMGSVLSEFLRRLPHQVVNVQPIRHREHRERLRRLRRL